MPPSTPDRPVSAVRRKNSLHGPCHKNRVEAAMPPSTPDRPVSAVRRKNSLHGPCHNKRVEAAMPPSTLFLHG